MSLELSVGSPFDRIVTNHLFFPIDIYNRDGCLDCQEGNLTSMDGMGIGSPGVQR